VCVCVMFADRVVKPYALYNSFRKYHFTALPQTPLYFSVHKQHTFYPTLVQHTVCVCACVCVCVHVCVCVYVSVLCVYACVCVYSCV